MPEERSHDDGNPLSRRRFLAAAAGLLPAGLAGTGLLNPDTGSRPAGPGQRRDTAPAGEPGARSGLGSFSSHAVPGADGLPPRVVGLRSLGGAFRFDPVGLLIEPGTELHWLNMGDFHTATAFHPDYDDQLPDGVPLRIPEGAEPWDSGMLGLTAGTQFTHAFEIQGVYDYFCRPHYSFGMVGRIVVGGPRGGPATRNAEAELSVEAREQMPSLAEITGAPGVTYEWASRVNGVLYLAANDGDPSAGADAVVRAVTRDETLEELAAGRWTEVQGRFADFLDTVESGQGYESMVQAGDRVKELLRSIHAPA